MCFLVFFNTLDEIGIKKKSGCIMYTDWVVCMFHIETVPSRDGKYVWGALKRRVYTRIFKAGCKDVYIRVGIWVIFPRYFRLNYLINSKDRIV